MHASLLLGAVPSTSPTLYSARNDLGVLTIRGAVTGAFECGEIEVINTLRTNRFTNRKKRREQRGGSMRRRQRTERQRDTPMGRHTRERETHVTFSGAKIQTGQERCERRVLCKLGTYGQVVCWQSFKAKCWKPKCWGDKVDNSGHLLWQRVVFSGGSHHLHTRLFCLVWLDWVHGLVIPAKTPRAITQQHQQRPQQQQ